MLAILCRVSRSASRVCEWTAVGGGGVVGIRPLGRSYGVRERLIERSIGDLLEVVWRSLGDGVGVIARCPLSGKGVDALSGEKLESESGKRLEALSCKYIGVKHLGEVIGDRLGACSPLAAITSA
jgi:hypothetical protein